MYWNRNPKGEEKKKNGRRGWVGCREIIKTNTLN